MGLLNNNKVITTPSTGLEGSNFKLLASNDSFDVYEYYRENSVSKNLKLTFRDYYAWCDTQKVYFVKGKITDTPKEIIINETNFPNLRKKTNNSYPSVKHIIACPFTAAAGGVTYGTISEISTRSVRICVIFENGQIYHNYPSCYDDHDFYNLSKATENVNIDTLFDKFDESVVWDIVGRKNPTNDQSLVETGAYYYNPALKSAAYEMHPAINQPNGYGNTVGFGATNSMNPVSTGTYIGKRARFWFPDRDDAEQVPVTYMGGYVADNLFTMIATYRTNSGTHPCRMCIFGTQDGGRSWYNMYEFAGHDRIKINNEYSTALSTPGAPLAQEGTAADGIYSVKRRTIIVPTEASKEPSNIFEYDTPINVESIVGTASDIIFTTTSNHGFNNGDVIIVEYQTGVSSNNRTFDWMTNSTTSATTGGNGIMFKVTVVNENSFKVSLYIYNTESGLPIRHIHALNRCKDGVAVSCGEGYPKGWILYDSIIAADAFDGYNVALPQHNNFVRLTSTPDAIQRPLGTVVQQEGKDTFVYYAADHAYTPMNDVEMPSGRTETFHHNSCGVWKTPINGIDSQKDNSHIKYRAIEPAFGFQQIDGAFIFVGMWGDLAISYDNGETWTNTKLPPHSGSVYTFNWAQDGCHFSGPTLDRKVSIDNILIQLKH